MAGGRRLAVASDLMERQIKKRRLSAASAEEAATPADSAFESAVSSDNEESKVERKKNAPTDAKNAPTDAKNAPTDAPADSQNSFFSTSTFESLQLPAPLQQGVEKMGLKVMTEIQAKCIPRMKAGKDILGAAQTGSGKTLSFVIPALDMMYLIKLNHKHGTGCIVISPTRELAMQIHDVVREVGQFMNQTSGLVIGGANRRTEAKKLGKGVNFLVATPGRLLDHLHNTPSFVYKNLILLVIDEADRILEIGFEPEMNGILEKLPKTRQTALFSATQTEQVADLARLSLKRPVFVEVKAKHATVSRLDQGYVICPAEQRFLLLFSFLKQNKSKKVMVFFSTCKSVQFHEELLNYVDYTVSAIHGKKKQAHRMATYYEFCEAESGTLLCTNVAARGLDIPKVDWIVQYDPPDDPKEYIHRVGRTARGAEATGRALLFLMPEEVGFLEYLKRAKVPVKEFAFSASKIGNVQPQMERIIEKNYYLHRTAREAYKNYLLAYSAHGLKDIFEVKKLNLISVARSFGFGVPPKVDFDVNKCLNDAVARTTPAAPKPHEQNK